MKIAGIVCEYNPFHNGHEYLINKAHREADAVVCVMSGHFVQRSDVAYMDKYRRAEVAVRRGADLVLELPFPYCMGGASHFAEAGIRILDSVGAQTLYFGSETGDVRALTESALRLPAEPPTDPDHVGSARAYFAETGEAGPNDILGMQYILAIRKVGSSIVPVTVKRVGDGYHEKEASSDKYASATALRRMLNGSEDVTPYISREMKEAFEEAAGQGQAPASLTALEKPILAFWRLSDPESLATRGVAGLGGGLAYRLHECAKDAASLSEFFSLAATKKYTDAFIRRAALSAVLGVLWSDLDTPVAYTTLLGTSDRGREILASARKNEASVPILTKNADLELLIGQYPDREKRMRRQFALGQAADELFGLSLARNVSGSFWMKKHAFVASGVDLSEKV